MSFQILYQNKAVPSYLLWHTYGKLLNLNLEVNAAIKLGSTKLVGKLSSLMIHFGFRVFDVNWLEGTLRKAIQS